jgi:hypothetical protein
MPVYEVLFYAGTGNWVLEGRGYRCSSNGEFDKVTLGEDGVSKTYEELVIRNVLANGSRLRNERELASAECVHYRQMMTVLSTIKLTHQEFAVD